MSTEPCKLTGPNATKPALSLAMDKIKFQEPLRQIFRSQSMFHLQQGGREYLFPEFRLSSRKHLLCLLLCILFLNKDETTGEAKLCIKQMRMKGKGGGMVFQAGEHLPSRG